MSRTCAKQVRDTFGISSVVEAVLLFFVFSRSLVAAAAFGSSDSEIVEV